MADISPETAALRAALESAQRDATGERTRRLEAENRLRTETGTRVSAQETAITSEIAQAERTATVLQDNIEVLLSEGKFKEAAAAQREMSDNSARLSQLRSQKEWVEQQKTAVSTTQADPLEPFNGAEREWISRNPRYLSDADYQQKVNAAAVYAQQIERLPKDTPEYFKFIEERANGQPRGAVDLGGGGDIGEQAATHGGDAEPNEPQDTLAISMPAPNSPAAGLKLQPEEPQQRAVGRPGNDGIRSVAAPPSRRMMENARRQLGPNRRIEPTEQELDIARQLYNDIEPNAEDRSDEAAVLWYFNMYNHPSHDKTRRRTWAGQSARGA